MNTKIGKKDKERKTMKEKEGKEEQKIFEHKYW